MCTAARYTHVHIRYTSPLMYMCTHVHQPLYVCIHIVLQPLVLRCTLFVHQFLVLRCTYCKKAPCTHDTYRTPAPGAQLYNTYILYLSYKYSHCKPSPDDNSYLILESKAQLSQIGLLHIRHICTSLLSLHFLA
jgi:hypothetical protein